MKHLPKVLVAALAVVVLAGGVSAFQSGADSAPQVSRPAVTDCDPAPAPCGVDQWAGVNQAVIEWDFQLKSYLAALEQERLAAEAAARRSSGGGGSRGSCDRPAYERAPEEDYKYGIPLNIVERESGGNYGSCNESSGACGAYQVLDSTWDGYGGYASACDAPPDVQDQWAREAYAQSGAQPWGG